MDAIVSPERPTIKAVRTSATRQASRLNFLREMGQICATAPSRFQGADFKACPIVFGAFRAKLLRKQLGILTEGYGVLIKGSIPTIHATLFLRDQLYCVTKMYG